MKADLDKATTDRAAIIARMNVMEDQLKQAIDTKPVGGGTGTPAWLSIIGAGVMSALAYVESRQVPAGAGK